MTTVIPSNIEKICKIVDTGPSRAPASVNRCADILNKCISGDSKCLEEFNDLGPLIVNNGIDYYKTLGGNDDVKNLLSKLKINTADPHPIKSWLNNLKMEAKGNVVELEKINKIANNNVLITVLKNFIVLVKTPTLIPGRPDYNEELRKLDKLSFLQPRVSRNSRPVGKPSLLKERFQHKPVDHIKLQTGGGNLNRNDIRLFDALENNFNMIGGGDDMKTEFHGLLVGLYNQYKLDLAKNNKEILREDSKQIDDLLAEFKIKETNFNESKRAIGEAINNANKNAQFNMNRLVENHKSLEKDVKNDGLTIIGILKCIKEGCNVPPEELWKNARARAADARIEDIHKEIEDLYKHKSKYESITSSALPDLAGGYSPTSSEFVNDEPTNANQEESFLDSIKKFFSWA